jgi:hypothetical protein
MHCCHYMHIFYTITEAFVDLLHDTVKAALIEGADEEMVKDASRRQEGWIHVQGELMACCNMTLG